jgi:hypothetical protein
MTASPSSGTPRLRRPWRLAVAVGSAIAVGGFAAPPAGQAVPDPGPKASAPNKTSTLSSGGENATLREKAAFYDSRTSDAGAKRALQQRRAQWAVRPHAGLPALRKTLGNQGLVDMDGLTGTPRLVAKLDGFLTGPSTAKPEKIARDYVAKNVTALGLKASDLANLTLRKDYVDIEGTHHLSFVQKVGGVPVFSNGLKADVAKDGRLIQLQGSPVSGLPASLAPAKLTAGAARTAALKDVHAAAPSGTFAKGENSTKVVFQTLGGPRLAWQSITKPAKGEMYMHVVDAQTGRVLYRRSLVQYDTGLAWDNYPGAASGGVQKPRDFTKRGWLPAGSKTLDGNVARVWLDVNDNNLVDPGEDVAPKKPGDFKFPFKDFTAQVGPPCTPVFKCSWNPKVPNSWKDNANQNGVQLLYYLGVFHDHLAKAPIGFTRAAGNFEKVDGDAVQGQGMDGANTANGLPDSGHVDNANMGTPPDGQAPTMQMYLFSDPAATPEQPDPFIAGNSGDDASIVYHEYVHGLSNRLVIDANGNSTLGNIQAGAMGEAWSDWYAEDYLVNNKFVPDTAADGEVRVGEYVGAGQDLIRSQPIDCSVGSTSPACHGTPGAGPGGYTYGDFGRVAGQPQVHADGEIWSETLWDLRKAIGVRLARSLVTRAMELAPANPSYLDMRNSIIQADTVVNGGKAHKRIWKVFAKRGMGFFAGSLDGDDVAPVEDFSMPPAPGTPTGSLTGKVTDKDSGTPVAGAVVAFGGHASGFAGDFAAVSGADGSYTISGILAGTYPKVFSAGPGFDRVTATLSIRSGTNTANWPLRRDWAAISGGSKVTAFNGPDFSDFGCGPDRLFDQSQGAGWGSDVVFNPDGTMQPRFVIVKLPVTVSVSEIQINPSNTCGDPGSSSTGRFRVETSTDGVTFKPAASGDFGIANRNRMNTVTLDPASTAGVQFVRYTMLSSQVDDSGGTCPGPFGGCEFVDSVELAVYGAQS